MINKNLPKINNIRNKIENLDKITFIELIKILGSIKARVLWGMVIGIFSYTSLVYFIATKIQTEKTAIALGDSFDISIQENEIQKCAEFSNQEKITCKNLFLLENISPNGTNSLHFQIRKIKDGDPLDIYPIGTVKANKSEPAKFPFISTSLNIDQIDQPESEQDSQPNFNWYGHDDNSEFHEKYIDQHTIQRYYEDGWILEYKVDQDERSIASTFKWIKKGKCLLGVCLPN